MENENVCILCIWCYNISNIFYKIDNNCLQKKNQFPILFDLSNFSSDLIVCCLFIIIDRYIRINYYIFFFQLFYLTFSTILAIIQWLWSSKTIKWQHNIVFIVFLVFLFSNLKWLYFHHSMLYIGRSNFLNHFEWSDQTIGLK